jgi:Ca-activated chloride channel family protein
VVAVVAAIAAAFLAALGEVLHAARLKRVARLAFGPGARPRAWTRAAAPSRVAAAAAVAWGLTTLLHLEPAAHQIERVAEGDERHVVLVLDVSPSMRLADAGPELAQSRLTRVRDLLQSFFRRVPVERYRVSVIAVYSGAKAVVVDTEDLEVVRNILGDLPMHYAFEPGRTKLFAGLEEAAELARPWDPGSATVVVLSDGDTVPATGMPRMPAAVRSVLVVGVGDARAGKWIDGKQSRQDVSTLRQIATRLGGVYADGNQRHVSSDAIELVLGGAEASALERLTVREYALIAVALGASILAFLPLALHALGTDYPAGAPRRAGAYTPRAAPGAPRTLVHNSGGGG